MDQSATDPGQTGRPTWQGGSVRAARERMEAGQIMDAPRVAGSARPTNSPKGVPISRPSPMPQWPLTNGHDSSSSDRNKTPSSNTPSQHTASKAPPRRPPRPSYVPSILDASRIQDHTPAFQYRQQQQQQQQAQTANNSPASQPQKYWEPTYFGSPLEPSTPGTGLSGTSNSSRPSTTSSYGSIPDFPIPSVPATQQAQQPQSFPAAAPQQSQPRRSIGPPPSSRRGASSYYSHSSFVAPIPEEMPESHRSTRAVRAPQYGSYASSHVIPQSWADGPPGYYTEAYVEEEDDDDDDDHDDDHDDERDGRQSRESEHDESSNLVRKASLGKQFKPTLTTVRSSSSSDSDESKAGHTPRHPIRYDVTVGDAAAAGTAAASALRKAGSPPLNSREDLLGGETYVEPHQVDTMGTTAPQTNAATTSLPNQEYEQDPRVQQIMGGLEKGGAIGRGVTPPIVGTPPRRPPRLNIDAVHEAEARGSLTSLTDLIKRATKVRSNLDRGKTASRLGMLDFGGSNPNLLDKRSPNHRRNSDSLSGMLASFPPPALTPQGEQPSSRWPSPFANSNPNLMMSSMDRKEGGQHKHRSRRCCGLPLWGFIVLLVLLILLIAAAVVVPIVLIVLPRMRDHNNATADLSNCATTHPCANGGTAVVSSDSCRCVCAGGFTGSGCSTKTDHDCTTSDTEGLKNATMSNSIPRLLSASSSNFSIPLNSTALLSTFAASNISCSDEEALITFNGRTKRGAASAAVDTALPPPPPPSPTVTAAALFAKAARASVPAAITSNGVVLDPSAETPVPTARTVSGNMPASAASESSSSSTPAPSDTDFARIAVLWVLQETQQLGAAIDAQTALKNKLRGVFIADTVPVGNGFKVDFLRQRITSNTTTVGG